MRRVLIVLVVLAAMWVPAFGADVAGKWTAAIDTQVGVMNYTYDFQVDGAKVTGRAKSEYGDNEIKEGVVKSDEISFVEDSIFRARC
jgi:hypothetical protein